MERLHRIIAARDALERAGYGHDPEGSPYPQLVIRDGVVCGHTLQVPSAFRARRLMEAIAAREGVSLDAIRYGFRGTRLTLIRKECAYVLRLEVGLSWPLIGRIMGGRDHTTTSYLAAGWQALHPHLPRVSGYDLPRKLALSLETHRQRVAARRAGRAG